MKARGKELQWLAIGATLAACGLSLPPARALIEQSMVWHMLVQMPMLMAAGSACAAAGWPGRPASEATSWPCNINRFGLTGLMLAQCIAAYWMLPSQIDRAVVLFSVDAAKLLSLWLAGFALGHSLPRAPLAVQLFFIGYGLPMLVWLGWYLASTDLRLCNAYSLESQVRAGIGLVLMAAALGLVWSIGLLLGHSRTRLALAAGPILAATAKTTAPSASSATTTDRSASSRR